METQSDKKEVSYKDCPIFVGTSGYSYNEWVEAGFYPAGTLSGKMLPVYARKFSITELNYTWYQMPRSEAVERQRIQVPEDFLFTAKLTRSLTHEIDSKQWPGQADDYRKGVAPLMQAGQLVAVLVQLSPSFRRTLQNRKYLAALLDKLAGLPLAVEFRHRSWAIDRVFSELEHRRVALVSVDEPDLPGLFPALDVVTSLDLFYVRFHGKNAGGWRTGNMQQQFDYDYSDDELSEWVENKIAGMSGRARRGVIFFNNHVHGRAPKNALRMKKILKKQGFNVV